MTTVQKIILTIGIILYFLFIAVVSIGYNSSLNNAAENSANPVARDLLPNGLYHIHNTVTGEVKDVTGSDLYQYGLQPLLPVYTPMYFFRVIIIGTVAFLAVFTPIYFIWKK